jgi:hypothetical protein
MAKKKPAAKKAARPKGTPVQTEQPKQRGRQPQRNQDFSQFAARVGANVLYLRKLRYGNDVDTVCEQFGISRDVWYRIERGAYSGQAGKQLDALAEFFGVDVSTLVLLPEEFQRKVKK